MPKVEMSSTTILDGIRDAIRIALLGMVFWVVNTLYEVDKETTKHSIRMDNIERRITTLERQVTRIQQQVEIN